MEITTEEKNGCTVATMRGSFTFGENQNFRAMLKELQTSPSSTVAIDLTGVEFIDSAALGMLLLLRDTMQSSGKILELRSPQGQIRKMFELSNFNELFTIKD